MSATLTKTDPPVLSASRWLILHPEVSLVEYDGIVEICGLPVERYGTDLYYASRDDALIGLSELLKHC